MIKQNNKSKELNIGYKISILVLYCLVTAFALIVACLTTYIGVKFSKITWDEDHNASFISDTSITVAFFNWAFFVVFASLLYKVVLFYKAKDAEGYRKNNLPTLIISAVYFAFAAICIINQVQGNAKAGYQEGVKILECYMTATILLFLNFGMLIALLVLTSVIKSRYKKYKPRTQLEKENAQLENEILMLKNKKLKDKIHKV